MHSKKKPTVRELLHSFYNVKIIDKFMAGAESITLTCQNSTVNFQNEKKKTFQVARFVSIV